MLVWPQNHFDRRHEALLGGAFQVFTYPCVVELGLQTNVFALLLILRS
jgi:hypothetical protein